MDLKDILVTYNKYVSDEMERTFGTTNPWQLISNAGRGHRSERLIDLALLGDKDMLLGAQTSLIGNELSPNYNRVLQALFLPKKKSPNCRTFCNMLIEGYGLNESMINNPQPEQEVLQTLKGLDGFIALLMRSKIELGVALVN